LLSKDKCFPHERGVYGSIAHPRHD
jgi:hypothetical protein